MSGRGRGSGLEVRRRRRGQMIQGYLRSISPIQQRQVLEDVEQDLLRQILPVAALLLLLLLLLRLLRLLHSAPLARVFQTPWGAAAGTSSVLLLIFLLILLPATFHPAQNKGTLRGRCWWSRWMEQETMGPLLMAPLPINKIMIINTIIPTFFP